MEEHTHTMSKARKTIRYFVERHKNRDGTISRRIWDVRELTIDQFGIEHVEEKMGSFPTRKEAQDYADSMTGTIKATQRLKEPDRRDTITAAIAAMERRLR